MLGLLFGMMLSYVRIAHWMMLSYVRTALWYDAVRTLMLGLLMLIG